MAEQTEQQKADRARILARIQKCLRLSKSSEPHEAAAALRQAQKLMQAHAISNEEVMGVEVTSALVLTPEPPKKKFPMYLGALVMLCCRAFNCQALYEVERNKNGKRVQGVRYFATGGRAEMAKYAHEVIWRQMWSSWNEHRMSLGIEAQLGERASFWLGWLAAVNQKVMEFGGSKEEEELIKKGVLRHCDGEEPEKAKMGETALYSHAARAGAAAAKDFSIHRPMEGSSDPENAEPLALGHDE